MDVQFLQPVRGCRQSWFRWQRRSRTGDVHDISLPANLNHDLGLSLGCRPGAGGFSRGERNDLFSHVMTPYLGFRQPSGPDRGSCQTVTTAGALAPNVAPDGGPAGSHGHPFPRVAPRRTPAQNCPRWQASQAVVMLFDAVVLSRCQQQTDRRSEIRRCPSAGGPDRRGQALRLQPRR